MDRLPAFSDEYSLWQAFKAGNEIAFDHIYDRYFARLYGYGVSLCPDKGLVKDCIQNLFVEIWRNRAHLADVHSIKYYLYTAFRRKIIRELTWEKRHLDPEELSETHAFETSFSHEWLLIHEQITEENLRKLRKAFDLLTKRQKEAIFLRFYENLEYEQIAEVMGLKEVKYARTLIYRALDVLKASIRTLAVMH